MYYTIYIILFKKNIIHSIYCIQCRHRDTDGKLIQVLKRERLKHFLSFEF